jgi:hypothetical protein
MAGIWSWKKRDTDEFPRILKKDLYLQVVTKGHSVYQKRNREESTKKRMIKERKEMLPRNMESPSISLFNFKPRF